MMVRVDGLCMVFFSLVVMALMGEMVKEQSFVEGRFFMRVFWYRGEMGEWGYY